MPYPDSNTSPVLYSYLPLEHLYSLGLVFSWFLIYFIKHRRLPALPMPETASAPTASDSMDTSETPDPEESGSIPVTPVTPTNQSPSQFTDSKIPTNKDLLDKQQKPVTPTNQSPSQVTDSKIPPSTDLLGKQQKVEESLEKLQDEPQALPRFNVAILSLLIITATLLSVAYCCLDDASEEPLLGSAGASLGLAGFLLLVNFKENSSRLQSWLFLLSIPACLGTLAFLLYADAEMLQPCPSEATTPLVSFSGTLGTLSTLTLGGSLLFSSKSSQSLRV